jgi:hypothetical protein
MLKKKKKDEYGKMVLGNRWRWWRWWRHLRLLRGRWYREETYEN